MKKNYVFWIVAVTAILSLSRALGILLTYSQNDFIHETGNFLFTNPLNFWLIIAFFAAGYFFIKKLPSKVVIIPLIFALMGLPFVFLTVTIIPIGADARNTLAFTIHLALAIYSFAILAKMKKEMNKDGR